MSEVSVAFRVDASEKIGTGHFMRCLTLADALVGEGVKVRFISRSMPEHFRDILAVRGFEFVLLDGLGVKVGKGGLAHSHWLSTDQEHDAQDTISALSDQPWSWLVVDHYALDTDWESRLRVSGAKLFVIDDLADRLHNCDLLLDQNLYSDMLSRYTGKVPGHCRLLLGPRYALLREDFRNIRSKVKARIGPVQRILISFGGVDADNNTGKFVDALVSLGIQGISVDVVIGAQNRFRKEIEAKCAEYGFASHVQTDRMAELMADADLAIGAGGSELWERCCMGLPALSICTSDNQKKQIADAASEGLLYAPEQKGNSIDFMMLHVGALLGNDHLRQFISRNAMQAVDGSGALRVLSELNCNTIEIKEAVLDDSRNLYEWRNDPMVRAGSRNKELISWETHRKWFARALESPDRLLLIGRVGRSPIGVVRFDIKGNKAEVSIYLVPGTGQKGRGKSLLRSAERWLAGNRPEIHEICAHVLSENEPSHRLFLAASYRLESNCYIKRLH